MMAIRKRPRITGQPLDRIIPTPRRAPVAASLFISGCSRAPAQDVLGSFFPAWMLCALLGILFAVLLRQALVLVGIHEHVLFPLLTYAACAAIGTMLTWLVWFGH